MRIDERAHLSPRNLDPVVYGRQGVALDDPAERYHEASKLAPSFAARELPGLALLESSPELQRLVTRATKRHPARPRLRLPPPQDLDAELGAVVGRRRSRRSFAPAPLPLPVLSTLLHASYGVTDPGEQPLRSVPSGGALYPLELYVVARRVGGLAPGVHHYDPLVHALEQLRGGELGAELQSAMTYPELAEAPVVVAFTATFWRSRFKYGLRAYRFALLEAGHAMQNLLLACEAGAVVATPVGGFYDRRLDALLGVDGVNESSVYCVSIGLPGRSS